jgi:ATP-dependent DNA helicase RecG
LNEDIDLLEAARATAEKVLQGNPGATRRHLTRWLGQRHEYLKV